MSSFLEKLKKGMGVENLQEEKTEENAEKELETEEKPKRRKTKERKNAEKEKQKSEKIKESRKLKIEAEKTELKTEKTEEPKEEMKKTEKDKKEQKQEIETKKENWPEREGELTVDVYQTNGELVIQTAVAGVKPEDLDISIESDAVLIKGRREKAAEKEEVNYFYQECWWGPFSRQIILPEEADPGRAQASMKEGILTIRIPKIEKNKKKKIEVKG